MIKKGLGAAFAVAFAALLVASGVVCAINATASPYVTGAPQMKVWDTAGTGGKAERCQTANGGHRQNSRLIFGLTTYGTAMPFHFPL